MVIAKIYLSVTPETDHLVGKFLMSAYRVTLWCSGGDGRPPPDRLRVRIPVLTKSAVDFLLELFGDKDKSLAWRGQDCTYHQCSGINQ